MCVSDSSRRGNRKNLRGGANPGPRYVSSLNILPHPTPYCQTHLGLGARAGDYGLGLGQGASARC